LTVYPAGYNLREIRKTARIERWLQVLRDTSAQQRIEARIKRLAAGNPGDHRILARGLRELKIDVGPGYRVYYVEIGTTVILLLAGGDKSTQRDDIATALSMIADLQQEN
jgi:putative addiction module killer protein